MTRPSLARAITHIQKAGILLLYPLKNQPEIPSLWNAFFPKVQMHWDWSEQGEDRIAELWHLRTDLSTSRKVVYTKWFRNRGTFFSLELFQALVSFVSSRKAADLSLGIDAQTILSVVNDDSPLATKTLKQLCEMPGRLEQSRFERAMKELWLRFLIVGYGEVDEGGYPSLAVGSSRLLFEDQWDASLKMTRQEREECIAKYFDRVPAFRKQYDKLQLVLK